MCKGQINDDFSVSGVTISDQFGELDNSIFDHALEELNAMEDDDSVFDSFHPEELLVACKSCYLPITKIELIIERLTENGETADVVERAHILTSYFRENSANELQNQWTREVFCLQCGLKLSFLTENVTDVVENY